MSQAITKVCRFCQTDVAGKPRIKDKKGRYACQPCFERFKASKQQTQHIPEPKSNPYSSFAPDIDPDAISLEPDDVFTAAAASDRQCPSCKAAIGATDVFCINCGTNVQTGGKAAKVKVKKPKPGRERNIDGGTVSALLSILFAGALAYGMVLGNASGQTTTVAVISTVLFFVYAAAMGILSVVEAFRQDGLVRMLMVWFLPFYGLYWVYARAESSLLKLNFSLVLVLFVAFFLAALSSMGI